MTQEINQLSGMLFDIKRALADITRVRDTLKSITWLLEIKIEEIHNSEEYQESIKKQLLGNVL